MQGQLLEHSTTVSAVSLLLDGELPGHGLWGKALQDTFPGIHHGHIAVANLSHVSAFASIYSRTTRCVCAPVPLAITVWVTREVRWSLDVQQYLCRAPCQHTP